ncbi:hypothetical protein P9869_41405 [Streptomyces ossamyceticus]|nr:hypothetical protein [Streptomyces ossamyceticus]
MKMPRKLTTVSVTAAAFVGVMAVAAPPASATSYNGCAYPRVCFYQTVTDWNAASPNAAYQDVTTSYQNLGPNSRGANHVWNTRNDDRAYLRYVQNGGTYYHCLSPNSGVTFNASQTVTGIRIDTASSC